MREISSSICPRTLILIRDLMMNQVMRCSLIVVISVGDGEATETYKYKNPQIMPASIY